MKNKKEKVINDLLSLIECKHNLNITVNEFKHLKANLAKFYEQCDDAGKSNEKKKLHMGMPDPIKIFSSHKVCPSISQCSYFFRYSGVPGEIFEFVITNSDLHKNKAYGSGLAFYNSLTTLLEDFVATLNDNGFECKKYIKQLQEHSDNDYDYGLLIESCNPQEYIALSDLIKNDIG